MNGSRNIVTLVIRMAWPRWRHLVSAWQRVWNQWWFAQVECSTLESSAIGAACTFHVPVRIAGGQGKLEIGERNLFGYSAAPRLGDGGLLIQPRGREAIIRIGSGTLFSNNVVLIANAQIIVGDRCLFGDQSCVFDSDFHALDPAKRTSIPGLSARVVIEDDVWIGTRVVVLKGVTIGRGTVVGAMSVVTKSLPPYCIAAGNPARVLRTMRENMATEQ